MRSSALEIQGWRPP